MNAATSSPPPRRRVWLRRGSLLLATLALLAVLVPLGLSAFRGPVRRSSPMLTHTVALSNLDVTVTEDGTLESSSNKEIKCKVKGGSTVLWVIETGTVVAPGDVLVELDTSQIEDNITQQQIVYENALANKIITESNVAVAKTSITEYLEGTYLDERNTIEKEIFDAEEAVKSAQLTYESTQRLAAKGVLRSLQLDGQRFAVESAHKELELKKRRLDSLEKYTKEKTLQELQSTLQAAEARLASDTAALQLELTRLDREKEQLENCTIRSDVGGMVIFPSAAEWKEQPDIEEGATVREQQTLLIIPDLNQMQVKVGIHESKVDRLQLGMKATVKLQERVLNGQIAEIATVTRPSGWWTGNMVKYDTIIKADSGYGLKPGMSAVVKVFIAEHRDVLTIPVAAVSQTQGRYCCWIKTATGTERRWLELSDSNDEFMVVQSGLQPGDEVVLNPRGHIDEAAAEALEPIRKMQPEQPEENSKPQAEKGIAKSKSPVDPSPKAKPLPADAPDTVQLASADEPDDRTGSQQAAAKETVAEEAAAKETVAEEAAAKEVVDEEAVAPAARLTALENEPGGSSGADGVDPSSDTLNQ